jgi:hypothetical protein
LSTVEWNPKDFRVVQNVGQFGDPWGSESSLLDCAERIFAGFVTQAIDMDTRIWSEIMRQFLVLKSCHTPTSLLRLLEQHLDQSLLPKRLLAMAQLIQTSLSSDLDLQIIPQLDPRRDALQYLLILYRHAHALQALPENPDAFDSIRYHYFQTFLVDSANQEEQLRVLDACLLRIQQSGLEFDAEIRSMCDDLTKRLRKVDSYLELRTIQQLFAEQDWNRVVSKLEHNAFITQNPSVEALEYLSKLRQSYEELHDLDGVVRTWCKILHNALNQLISSAMLPYYQMDCEELVRMTSSSLDYSIAEPVSVPSCLDTRLTND